MLDVTPMGCPASPLSRAGDRTAPLRGPGIAVGRGMVETRAALLMLAMHTCDTEGPMRPQNALIGRDGRQPA